MRLPIVARDAFSISFVNFPDMASRRALIPGSFGVMAVFRISFLVFAFAFFNA